MKNLSDVVTSIMSGVQMMTTSLIILGGVAGVVCALTAMFLLWKKIADGEHHQHAHVGSMGLVLAIIIGSIISIFAVIVGWFSLFYTQ